MAIWRENLVFWTVVVCTELVTGVPANYNQVLYLNHTDTDGGYFSYILQACEAIRSGHVFSAVLTGSCLEVRLLEALLRQSGLAYVTVTRNPCRQAPFSLDKLSIRHHVHIEARRVIRTVLASSLWRQLVLIHDGCADDWLDKLIDILNDDNVSVFLFNSPNEYASKVASLRGIDIYAPYLVISRLSTMYTILQQIQSIRAPQTFNRLLVYTCDDGNKTAPAFSYRDRVVAMRATPAGQQMIHNARKNALQVVLLASQSLSTNQSHEPDNSSCRSPHSLETGYSIINAINDSLLTTHKDTAYFEYKLGLEANSRVNYLNTSSHDKLYIPTDIKDMLLARGKDSHGFNNQHFVVATIEYSFFQIKVPTANGKFRWDGLTFELLNELSHLLNFSYSVVESPDNLWGIANENGSWNGLIRMVKMKEVDFAAASFSVTASRQSVVDFCSPYFHESQVVIIRRPQEKGNAFLYLRPFRVDVWLLLVVSIPLTGFALWCIMYLSPVPPTLRHTRNCDSNFHSVINSVWYIFGSFFQQGGHWLPIAQSARFVIAGFWFFSIIVVATYTGNLIAFLAVSKVQMPFDDLWGLIQQTTMTYGTIMGVALVMLFRDSSFEPFITIYENLDQVESYETALHRVKQGKYAFIAEKSWYTAKSTKECDITMLKEEFYSTSYAWAFQTGSPLVQIFSHSINNMHETGLLGYWEKKWSQPMPICEVFKPKTTTQPTTLSDFHGAVYILCTGLILSMLSLLAETLYNYYKTSRQKRNLKETL